MGLIPSLPDGIRTIIGNVKTGTTEVASAVQSSSVKSTVSAIINSVPGLPNIKNPINAIPLPSGITKVLPSRTLTGLIPPQVRNLMQFAQLARKELPADFGGLESQASIAARVRSLNQIRNTQFDKYFASSGINPNNTTATRQSTSDRTSADPTGTDPIALGRPGWLSPYANNPLWMSQVDYQTNIGNLITDDPRRYTPDQALKFQFNPEEVNIRQSAGWIVTNLPGRSHPFVQWGGSEAQTISFTLKFAFTQNAIGDVTDCVDWIRAFTYPNLNSTRDRAAPPTRLRLFLGRIFTFQGQPTQIPAILTKCDIKFHKLFSQVDLSPLYADLQLEFIGMVPRGQAQTSTNAGLVVAQDISAALKGAERSQATNQIE